MNKLYYTDAYYNDTKKVLEEAKEILNDLSVFLKPELVRKLYSLECEVEGLLDEYLVKLETIETLTEKVEDLEVIVDDYQYRNRG